MWTITSLLQLLARLLGDYKILHACQQRFALGQIHAKRFHRQFPPLDRQDLPASFVAIVSRKQVIEDGCGICAVLPLPP